MRTQFESQRKTSYVIASRSVARASATAGAEARHVRRRRLRRAGAPTRARSLACCGDRHRGPTGRGLGGAAGAATGTWLRSAIGGWRSSISRGARSRCGRGRPGRSLTYNGEVYNFAELRAPLEGAGHAFRTRSDTEVLLQHCARHGAGGSPTLDGMFAFAHLGHARRRLLLARDRCGIKPLYYAGLPARGLVFASELTALLAHAASTRSSSPRGLQSYFFSRLRAPAAHARRRGVRSSRRAARSSGEHGRSARRAPYWQRSRVRSRRPRGTAIELGGRPGRGSSARSSAQLVVRRAARRVPHRAGIDSSWWPPRPEARGEPGSRPSRSRFEDGTFDETRTCARWWRQQLGSEHVKER